MAVRAFDNDADKIVGILTRRDQRSPSDWIRIVVDSYFDRRSVRVRRQPVGVKTDRYYFNDGQSDDSWDAVWDVQVEKDHEGWRAEFRIPFSQLRFNNTSGGPVGSRSFARSAASRRRQPGRCCPAMPTDSCRSSASCAAEDVGRAEAFELMPYSLGKVDTRRLTSPIR